METIQLQPAFTEGASFRTSIKSQRKTAIHMSLLKKKICDLEKLTEGIMEKRYTKRQADIEFDRIYDKYFPLERSLNKLDDSVSVYWQNLR